MQQPRSDQQQHCQKHEQAFRIVTRMQALGGQMVFQTDGDADHAGDIRVWFNAQRNPRAFILDNTPQRESSS
ncbi:hypothetical protein MP631_08220 [Xanthomonas phaseoli pv. phaseoli]|nr:hypothetical protein MP631_08220 [Xanthomonas phaseoli pv. phaseoli]